MNTDQILNLALPACIQAYRTRKHLPLALPADYELVDTLGAGEGWGLVAANGSKALIATRGTNPESIGEWLEDFEALLVPVPWDRSCGLIHKGFSDIYLPFRDQLHAIMSTLQTTELLVTGHSLGGPLATQCAYDFRALKPQVVTFASPRVGNGDFAHAFDCCVPQIRVVNWGDFVPMVPCPPLFRHVGQELAVDGGHSVLNPAVAHALTAYQAGLGKLAA